MGPPAPTLLPYARADGSRRPFVRLDLNENRFPVSPAVLRALRRLRAADLSMYPEEEPLRQRLARFHGVAADGILLANGGDAAIRWVFEALVAPGREVAWAAPTFAIYPLAAALRRARVRAVPFGRDLAFPLAGILASLAHRPALLVLVSPNNPTGTVVGDDELRTILRRAAGTPVLLDEAYGFFAGCDRAAWTREFPNLIVLNSFSKSFALAGLRLGYLVAAPGLRRAIAATALPFPVCAAAVAAGLGALGDVAHARTQAQCLRRQKSALLNGLAKLGVSCHDTEANFLLAAVGDAGRMQERLRRAGVLVKSFGHEPQLAGRLRITVGTTADNRALLRALARELPPQALLFDMDGVLVDSRPSCDEAVLRTVGHFCGRRPTLRQLRRVRLQPGFNNDWLAAMVLIRAEGRRVPFARVKDYFQEIYLGAGQEGLRLREKWIVSKVMLSRLKKRFHLGIVTGRPRAEALWTLERSGCAAFFTVLVAAEDTGQQPKPHPRGIHLALRHLGAGRALFFGDQVDDMLAARAAGCRAAAVVWTAAGNAGRRRALRAAGAEWVISDKEGFLEVIHETSNG